MTGMRTGRPLPFAKAIDTIDFEFVSLQRLAVFDDAKLCGRAAHVERKQIAMAGKQTRLCRSQSARRRSRFEQAHRKTRRSFARRDAAAREHDEETADKTDLVQTRLQLVQVIRDPLLNINVRQRRAGTLELADLRDHFRAERYANLRRDCGDDLRRASFVRRIAKTVEIADADRLDPLVTKLANQAADKIFVERREHAAIGSHPLRHIEAQVARHQRFRQIEIQIIQFVAMLAADLHGVAKARRGEERRQRTLALDQRVGHQGRAVNKRAALTGFYRAVFQRRPERILDGQTRIARSSKRLADHCCTVVADQQHVGEGSTNIDTYTVHK